LNSSFSLEITLPLIFFCCFERPFPRHPTALHSIRSGFCTPGPYLYAGVGPLLSHKPLGPGFLLPLFLPVPLMQSPPYPLVEKVRVYSMINPVPGFARMIPPPRGLDWSMVFTRLRFPFQVLRPLIHSNTLDQLVMTGLLRRQLRTLFSGPFEYEMEILHLAFCVSCPLQVFLFPLSWPRLRWQSRIHFF